MGQDRQEQPNQTAQRIEDTIVSALKNAKPPLAKGQVKEVVATLRHSISTHEELANLEAILDERTRLWKLVNSAYTPRDWFSESEIDSMPESARETPPESIESELVKRAIEQFYKRDGCEILLAVGLDEETSVRSALSATGYKSTTAGSPEMALKKIGDKGGLNVIVATNYDAVNAIALYEQIRDAYPNVPFLVISKRGKGDESGPILAAKEIQYVVSEPLNRDEFVIRLDQMVEEIRRNIDNIAFAPKEGEVSSANNHACILMGPTCAGKSEISSRLTRKMSGVALARKSVSRRRRHKGEEDVEPHSLFKDPKGYFLTWEKGGVKAGLRYKIFAPFEQGNDLLIPVSELGVLEELKGYVAEKYPERDAVVPVMIMSDKDELLARFTKRGFSHDENIEKRRLAMDWEIGNYIENMQRFLSVIVNNSGYHTEEEMAEDAKVEDLNVVVNRMQRLLKRLRDVPLDGYSFPEYHQKFVNDSVKKLFGYESFENLLRAQEGMGGRLNLEFSDDEIRQFLDDREYPVEYMEYGSERNVVAVKSNGRAVLVVDAYSHRKNGVDPDTEFFTGLIERRLGRAWQRQDTSAESGDKTPYGLVKCPGAAFRGGVHFALTDKFPFDTSKFVYALDVVYIKGNEGNSNIESLKPEELDAMRKKAIENLNKGRSDMDLV